MARQRLLNGRIVALSGAEEAQRDAEDLAFANAPVKLPPVGDTEILDALVAVLKSKGVIADADVPARPVPEP